jgi:hypothetical protein
MEGNLVMMASAEENLIAYDLRYIPDRKFNANGWPPGPLRRLLLRWSFFNGRYIYSGHFVVFAIDKVTPPNSFSILCPWKAQSQRGVNHSTKRRSARNGSRRAAFGKNNADHHF